MIKMNKNSNFTENQTTTFSKCSVEFPQIFQVGIQLFILFSKNVERKKQEPAIN